jgi:hypothetical protein
MAGRIKDLVEVIVNSVPRLSQDVFGTTLTPHAHAAHSALDADDHLQYMLCSAGDERPFTGDVYFEAGVRLVGEGDLRLDDAYRVAHTVGGGDWTQLGVDLSSSPQEWQDWYDIFGAGASLLKGILDTYDAAVSLGGGVTLDGAYDFGGAGAGNDIEADIDPVTITVPDEAGNAALALVNDDLTNKPSTLTIERNCVPTNWYENGFSVFLTGSNNQTIIGDVPVYVGVVDSSTSHAFSRYHIDGTTGCGIEQYARSTAGHEAWVKSYTDATISYLTLYADNLYFDDAHRSGSTWTGALGIRVAETSSEWDDMKVLGGGEVSLFALFSAAAASGGGGGDWDTVYDYGGSGAGRSSTVDNGSWAATVPAGASNSAMTLSNLESTNTSEVLNIFNDADASTGYAIYLGGDAGADTAVSQMGHKIWTQGSITLGHWDDNELATGRRSFVSLQYTEQPIVPGVPSCTAILEASANEDGVLDYSSLYARITCESGDYTSAGSNITAETVGSFRIDAGTYGNFTFGGVLTIDATAIDLGDSTKLKNMASASYGSGPTTASFASNTVTADFSGTKKPFQEVEIDDDITALSLTVPIGVSAGMTIKVINTDAYDHTIGGITNVEWMDSADLSGAAAATISAEDGWLMIFLYYDGTTWHGWFGNRYIVST